MTRQSKTWPRRAMRGVGMALNSSVKVADKVAGGVFKYLTTDHLGITKDLPSGLTPWQELKFVWSTALIRIGALLLVWAVFMAVILILGQQ